MKQQQHGCEALERGRPGARPLSGQTTLLCSTLPCPALLCLLSLLWFREMSLMFQLQLGKHSLQSSVKMKRVLSKPEVS